MAASQPLPWEGCPSSSKSCIPPLLENSLLPRQCVQVLGSSSLPPCSFPHGPNSEFCGYIRKLLVRGSPTEVWG